MKHSYYFLALLLGLFFNANTIVGQERILGLQEPFVILIDPADGSILDPAFIDLTAQDQGLPKDIIQVNDELWISDQSSDRIYRFDLEGTFLSTITGAIDNIKGMAVINDTEVWVTNAGTNNSAPGNALVRFDFDGNNLGFYDTAASGSSFDIIDTGTEVYVSYISGDTKIERRDYSGNILGNIVEENVVSFIQQMEINTSSNSAYASVFSSLGPNTSGLYEFSITDGSILNYYNEGGLRGVAILNDGNILFSSGNDLKLLNVTSGVSTVVSSGGSTQYFAKVSLTPCTAPAAPTGDAVQTLIDGSTLADVVVSPTDVTWFETAADAMANENALPLTTVLVDGENYFAVRFVDDCPSDAFEVTINVVLSIGDFNSANIKIFPNPVENILIVSHQLPLVEVSISNLLGQIVFEMKTNLTELEIDMSAFSKGVYLLTVRNQGQLQSLKVVKE